MLSSTHSKKLLLILLLYLAIKSASSLSSTIQNQLKQSNDNITTISSAIVQAIEKIYSKDPERYDLLVLGEMTHHIKDVVAAVVKQLKDPIKVTRMNYVSNETKHFMRPTVMFTSNIEHLNRVNKYKRSEPREQSIKFIVYCENFNNKSFKLRKYGFFKELTYLIVKHEYIVAKINGLLQLLTIRDFSEKSCQDAQLVSLDMFDEDRKRWQKNLTNFENNRNFHGCALGFSGSHGMMFNFKNFGYSKQLRELENDTRKLDEKIREFSDRDDTEYTGLIYEVAEILANIGNFTPFYELTSDRLYPTKIYSRDLIAIRLQLPKLSQATSTTTPFYKIKVMAIVTPNELLSNYEKILLPFDDTSWILFGVSFIVVFVVILIINRKLKIVQSFIYGKGIRDPLYNGAGTFFGISQLKLPTENCPRILVIFFIYFCLLFRTCYQGRMFDYMTSDMRKPLPETVDDLYFNKYTLVYITNFTEYYNKSFEVMGKSPENISISASAFLNFYCANLHNDKKKYAFVLEQLYYNAVASKCPNIPPPAATIIITDIIESRSLGMFMTICIYEIFRETMDKLIEFGIANYLLEEGQISLYGVNKHSPNHDNRKIFSLHDLEYGFVLWLIACGISTIAFFFELIIGYVVPKVKKLIRTMSASSSNSIIENQLLHSNDNITSISSAIVQAIEKIYLKDLERYDLLVLGEMTHHLNDILTAVIKELKDPINVTHMNYVNDNKENFMRPTVMFTSNIELLNTVNINKRSFPKQKSLKFIIYCENFNENLFKVQKYGRFKEYEHLIIKQEYLIAEVNGSLQMFTVRDFTEELCQKMQFVSLDTFDENLKSWRHNLTNFENNQNFYGCALGFSASHSFMFHFKNFEYNKQLRDLGDKGYKLYREFIDLDDTEYTGIIYEVVESMAKVGNFSPYYRFNSDRLYPTKIYSRDLIAFRLQLPKTSQAAFTTALFYKAKVMAIVTPNELLNNYEKIFLPFDETSWILFGVSFVVIFLAILMINRKLKAAKDIIYGKGIRDPLFDAAGTFFGISQLKLPTENCPRILIIFFIYFCLLFRTCYQGRMFDYMTSDMRKPLPETVRDLFDYNYTLVFITNLTDNYNASFQIMDYTPKSMSINSSVFLEFYCNNLHNDKVKLAFVVEQMFLNAVLTKCPNIPPPAGIITITEIVESRAFGTSMATCIYKIFQEVVNKFVESGIASYLFETGQSAIYGINNYSPNPDNLRVFSLHDLEYGFVLWLIACGISTIAFFIELIVGCLVPKVKELIKTLVGLFSFIKLLRRIMEVGY